MEFVKKEGNLKLIGAQFCTFIDYIPQDISKIVAFVQDLVKDLQICNKETAGKWVQQIREEMKVNLVAEKEMKDLIKHIGEENTRVEAVSKNMR